MLAPGDFNLSMMTKLKKKNTLLAIFQMRNTTRFLCIVLFFFSSNMKILCTQTLKGIFLNAIRAIYRNNCDS